MVAAPSATYQHLDRFLDGDVPIAELEQWVYATPELERDLGPRAYSDLLEFDYGQAHADLALSKLIEGVYENARPGMLIRDRAYRYARGLIDQSMPAHRAVHGLANLWYDGYEWVWADFAGISSEFDDTPTPEAEVYWHPEARAKLGAKWAERRQEISEEARGRAREFLRADYPGWGAA